MGDKPWKATERKVSRFFGAERNRLSGSSGRADCSRSDSTQKRLFIECKHTRTNAAMVRLFESTAEFAKAEGKVPVLGLKASGQRGEFVVCRLSDFDAVAVERFKAEPNLFWQLQKQCMEERGE